MSKWAVRITVTEPCGDVFPEEIEFDDRAEMVDRIRETISSAFTDDEIEICIRPGDNEGSE